MCDECVEWHRDVGGTWFCVCLSDVGGPRCVPSTCLIGSCRSPFDTSNMGSRWSGAGEQKGFPHCLSMGTHCGQAWPGTHWAGWP